MTCSVGGIKAPRNSADKVSEKGISMRITTDYHEFFRTTKTIFNWYRLRELGLILESPVGNLWPSQVQEALDLCAYNPALHVVSHMGNGIFINRYDKRGKLFSLAEGDSDPHYILDTRHLYQWMHCGDFDKDEVLASLKDGSN